MNQSKFQAGVRNVQLVVSATWNHTDSESKN